MHCYAVRPISFSLFALFVFTQATAQYKQRRKKIRSSTLPFLPLVNSPLLIPSFLHSQHLLISVHSLMNPHRTRKPVDEFDDTPAKYPSQLPPKTDGKNPHVMIVGAGLAGLLLAILLDKAGIPYEIFERAASVKPLGMIGGEGQLLCTYSRCLYCLSPLVPTRVHHVAYWQHPCRARTSKSLG